MVVCGVCKEEADGHSIACEKCLEWFHLKCVGLKRKPNIPDWFCKCCLDASTIAGINRVDFTS